MPNDLWSPLSWKLIVLVVVGLLVIAFLLGVLPRYSRYLELARERQRGFGSQMIDTACGPVEYATAGEGPPVLVSHGSATGYDEGITTGQPLVRQGFRVIAPSRFGYQRTPVPSAGSPADQADAYACLLDALGVDRAGVIGVSAGGLSALQFALRHPDRVSALVLLVPAAYSPEPQTAGKSPSVAIMLAAILKSDFVLWATTQLDAQTLLGDIGVPAPIQAQMTAEQKSEIMGWLFPFGPRVDGIMNDTKNMSGLGVAPIEQITAPTLAVSFRDDQWNTYGPAEYTASHIPNAEFVGQETGGHLGYGHEEETWTRIVAFFKQHSS